MEKGSVSLNKLRWLEVLVGDLPQKDLFSSFGDGCGGQRVSDGAMGRLPVSIDLDHQRL